MNPATVFPDVLGRAVYRRWLASGNASTTADIAASTGLSVATVRKRIAAGRGFIDGCANTDVYVGARRVDAWEPRMEALRELLSADPVDLPETPGACETCEEQGWIVVSGGADIERCDDCKIYDSDDAALAAAVESAIEALKDPRPRAGVRFEKLLEALAVAAAVIRGGNEQETDE